MPRGRIVRHHFRSPLEIITKADDSPVTIADREAEKELRRMVALAYPQHGLIGEEFPAERRDADYVWVFDPIDGTKSFITGRPLFGTLIALLHRGRPILGIIDHPALGERWIGAAGRPSSFNGAPARVRPCAALAKAVLAASSPHMFGTEKATAAFERVRAKAGLTMYGADCYAYGLLASGFHDLVVEANNGIHDFLALVPVIEGAGGIDHRLGRPGAGPRFRRQGAGRRRPADACASAEAAGRAVGPPLAMHSLSSPRRKPE